MRAYLLGGRPIHYPFLSGILSYTCAGCDAPCCKGAQLGIGRSRELVTLQRALPGVELFSAPGFYSSAMLSVSSPLEACWFLDSKDRCRLHRAGGQAAKPAGCRLFPFQRLRSLGEAVTVLPDFVCPIGVEYGPSDEGQTSHDEITLEMHRAGIPRGGHAPLPPPRDMPWKQAVPLERKIVEASEHHLDDDDYLEFALRQDALTHNAQARGKRKGRLGRVRDTIERFLDIRARPSREAVHDLVALSGTLRLMSSTISRREMSPVLVALSCLVGAYEGMKGARRSPRTIVSMYEQRLPFLYVLAHLDDRPMVRDTDEAKRIVASLPAVRAPLLEVLEGMVDNEDLTIAETLDDILRTQGKAFTSPLSPDAVTMLHGLGRVLLRTGMFVPM
jgi:hypothetical protein